MSAPRELSPAPAGLTSAGSGGLWLTSLGALRLQRQDTELLRGRRRELVLLTYVSRSAPRPVPRESLAALLWGDRSEASARHSLRQTLVRLRQAIGDALLQVDGLNVSIAPDALALDATLFERALRDRQLADAVALWHGDFLAGMEDIGCDAFRGWLETEREGLRSRYAWALEQLTASAESSGDWDRAASWAERWVALRPLDEQAHIRLIQSLRAAGRVDDAVAHHAAFVRRLREMEAPLSSTLEKVTISLREPVKSAPPAPRGSGKARKLLSPNFVGRSDPLDSVLRSWQRVQSGGNEVIVIVGEEGMGKSRFCQEVLARLSSGPLPAIALAARASSAGEPVPWLTAGELFAPLIDAPGLIAASPESLAEMSRILPSLHSRFRHLPQPSGNEHRLLDAVIEVLGEVSSEVPIVMSLDDIAAADAESRRLLLAIVRRRPKYRGLLLSTATPGDLRVGGALDALRDDPEIKYIRLEPLSPDIIDALVGDTLELPEAERHGLSARIAEESGGTPQFVVELLGALADDGRLRLTKTGTWSLTPAWTDRPLPEPANVREIISRRLAQLDSDAATLVDAAAVLDGPFDIETAARITGLPRAAVYNALNTLIARRILRDLPPARDHYAFTHGLTRRVAYGRLSAERRELLHRRANGGAVAPPARRSLPTRWKPSRWWALGGVLTALVVAGAWRWIADARNAAANAPIVIAVGRIDDFTHGAASSQDSLGAGPSSTRAIAALLTTNLARLSGLHVVSSRRMYELAAASRADADPYDAAARRAGAGELLEGDLYRRGDGSLRLDLRRIDLATNAVRRAYAVEAHDPFALVDSATSEIAASGIAPRGRALVADADVPRSLGEKRDPRLRVADVTTTSFLAYQLFERGLRAFYIGNDAQGAELLFGGALHEDSLFAAAAYYLARTKLLRGEEDNALFARAGRLASRAPPRERLFMRAEVALMLNEPDQLQLADSVAARYPDDPEAVLLRGRARVVDGDVRGLADLGQVVVMDSLSFVSGAVCRACDALDELVQAYWRFDSIPQAERLARDWQRRRPQSTSAALAVSGMLMYQDRIAEAIRMRDSVRGALHLDSALSYPESTVLAEDYIRAYRFGDADRLLNYVARKGSPGERGRALWDLTISLRAQGRPRAALGAVAGMEAAWLAFAPDDSMPSVDANLARAQSLLEAGQPEQAARLFRWLAAYTPREPYMQARAARHRAWTLTLAATAYAVARDTAQLSWLADSVQALGRQSAYGRDRRLHDHIRGLLALARGQAESAAAAFSRAIFSPTAGYTRTNYDLGRTLLGLHRPDAAIAVLRPALHGSLEASNFYVTRTELEQLLAEAFAAAGQRDSAAAHRRIVDRAWAHAEPDYLERRRLMTGTVSNAR